ncbi:MAG: hypothetical protein JRH11_19750 [Deltaproteobacteria bacterium]|nr:hypothetical protein [Deltaproteobacteria bacterium]
MSGLITKAALTLALLLTSGCVKILPQAATPEPIAPAVAGSPPQGQGRLVVDVVDGPTEVQHVTLRATPRDHDDGRQTYSLTESFEALCPASPCVLDAAPGNVAIGFPTLGSNKVEVEIVHVSVGTSVYRRSLSEYHDDTGAVRVLGIIGTSVGVVAAITGGSILSAGLSDGNDDIAIAGGIILGSGAVLMILGILGLNLDAPTLRPGSAIHFPL